MSSDGGRGPGDGAEVGVLPVSRWSNLEPEVFLAVKPSGRAVGASSGNGVNLRDVEGRSALLLGRANNNAFAAICPFVRLFDEGWGLDEVQRLDLAVIVERRPAEGDDGFVLEGYSSRREISRDPLELVAQAMARHHQHPDEMMLYLGTLLAPTEDRTGRWRRAGLHPPNGRPGDGCGGRPRPAHQHGGRGQRGAGVNLRHGRADAGLSPLERAVNDRQAEAWRTSPKGQLKGGRR